MDTKELIAVERERIGSLVYKRLAETLMNDVAVLNVRLREMDEAAKASTAADKPQGAALAPVVPIAG